MGVGECEVSALPLPFGSFQCLCYEGNDGEACERSSCPNGCSGNGVCFNEECICFDGFFDSDCGSKLANKTCECKDRCQGICLPSCQQRHKAEMGEEVKDCALGCMETCQASCMRSDRYPKAPAKYCESRQCQMALKTRGNPTPYKGGEMFKPPPGSVETNLMPGFDILDNGYSINRHGDLIKSLDFASDHTWGQKPVLDDTPQLENVVVPAPKLDLDQIAVDGLSPQDMELIMKGPKPSKGKSLHEVMSGEAGVALEDVGAHAKAPPEVFVRVPSA